MVKLTNQTKLNIESTVIKRKSSEKIDVKIRPTSKDIKKTRLDSLK